MPWGKTCFRSRSETARVRLRASTFLVWFHAFRATIAHAAPAASHSNDSTPRALSWGLRTGGSGFVFIMRGLPAAGPTIRIDLPLGKSHGQSTVWDNYSCNDCKTDEQP